MYVDFFIEWWLVLEFRADVTTICRFNGEDDSAKGAFIELKRLYAEAKRANS